MNATFRRAAAALVCAGALLAAGAAWAQAKPPAADCPPVAQAPTEEQLQAAFDARQDHGFLWRISKGGRSSYLYGTVHLGKPAWAFPGETVGGALQQIDTLALELDFTDPAMLERMQAGIKAPARLDALPAALRQRLDRQIAAACLPPAAIAAQHPVMQAMTLTVLSARRDGLDPMWAQEISLGQLARNDQVPIVSLESPELQLSALIPTDKATAQRVVEQMLTQLEKGHSRAMLVRMAAMWEKGDLKELESYETWCDCITTEADRAMLRKLNDDRNPGLAARIDALHGEGKSVFAAVGALHMTGAQGLPLLMQQRGYAVERVEFGRR